MTNLELHPSWLIFSGVALALLPLIIPVITGWTKITIILGFIRNGMGFQHTGAALVDGSLGLLIALVVSAPITSKVFSDLEDLLKTVNLAKGPTSHQAERIKSIVAPWRSFLEKNSGSTELRIAAKIAHSKRPLGAESYHSRTEVEYFKRETTENHPELLFNLERYLDDLQLREADVEFACTSSLPPITAISSPRRKIGEFHTAQQFKTNLIQGQVSGPSIISSVLAFFLTEIREGLVLGLKILVPFLIVDFVVANLLAGMGMFLLSPQVITLPLKVLLFIGAGGYALLTQGAVLGYVY